MIMRDGNASMYLGSPRMAEMVIGEKVTLEEMGGARMHTSRSGCGHALVPDDEEAIDFARRYLATSRRICERAAARRAAPPPPITAAADPRADSRRTRTSLRHAALIDALLDAGSFLEIHARWARGVIVGFARLDGRAVGIVANQPKVKGGVLFVDSSDKAARFIWTCNAFNIPLLFLADVPGFMIGTQVEREGIIRARREDDQRRVRGDRAEDLGDRPQGLRRRPLRDGRAGVRARTAASRCRPRRLR